MGNLDISYYDYFKHWLKTLESEDIGALMLVIPFSLGMFTLVVILATYEPWATLVISLMVLWFGTAIYFLTKD